MKTGGIDDYQRKTIYGIARSMGICEAGNREDGLHLLVAGMTGKESLKELSCREASDVIRELKKRQGHDPKPERRDRNPGVPGMMTPGQKRKAWALMYSLIEEDQEPAGAEPGERLCAVIRKELHADCIRRDPFRFLDFQAGNRLIEILKCYVKHAAGKQGVG